MIRGRRLEHAVAGLLGAAGLGDHDDEGVGQAGSPSAAEHAVHAVGIGVVEEEDAHPVAPGPAGRRLTNCGPSAEPPMPMTSRFSRTCRALGSARRLAAASVDVGGKGLDGGEGAGDFLAQLRCRGAGRRRAASNGRPSGSRPGWRWRRLPVRPWRRRPFHGGDMAWKKASLKAIREMSSARPSDGQCRGIFCSVPILARVRSHQRTSRNNGHPVFAR